MTDITTRYLEAAIMDQTVAGLFSDQPYAFVAVYHGGDWQLGVAVANETGFNPIGGKTFQTSADATQWAAELNEHIGRTDEDAWSIVCSTMGGQYYYTPTERRPEC